jgi:hypothetical protein
MDTCPKLMASRPTLMASRPKLMASRRASSPPVLGRACARACLGRASPRPHEPGEYRQGCGSRARSRGQARRRGTRQRKLTKRSGRSRRLKVCRGVQPVGQTASLSWNRATRPSSRIRAASAWASVASSRVFAKLEFATISSAICGNNSMSP